MRGWLSGQAPVGQGALGVEPHRAAGPGWRVSTVPMIVRFSWPVNVSAWRVHGEARRPGRHRRGLRPRGEQRSRRRRARCVCTGRHSGKPLASTTVRSWVGSRPRFCAAASPRRRRSHPGSGCLPLGAGSDRGAAVPSGAFQRAAPVRRGRATRPPPHVQRRHLDPDARRSTTPVGGARSGAGPWWPSGSFSMLQRHVAVGVGLEVRVAHGGEALDEHHRRVGRARADGVGEQAGTPAGRGGPARPWPGR